MSDTRTELMVINFVGVRNELVMYDALVTMIMSGFRYNQVRDECKAQGYLLPED